MTHAHNDWQSRADSMRRFAAGCKDDLTRMRAGRDRLLSECREARRANKISLAWAKITQAKFLRQKISEQEIWVRSLDRQIEKYQSAADHQRQAKEFLEAAQ